MLKPNFVIGDEKNRSMKNVETSYNPAVTSNMKSSNNEAALKAHYSVSVKFGSHQQDFISEAKHMFTNKIT